MDKINMSDPSSIFKTVLKRKHIAKSKNVLRLRVSLFY